MTAAPRLPAPAHTLQRKNCLAHGRPTDHVGRVSATCDPAFDLQRTIFATLRSPISRVFQRTKLDARLSWDEAAAAAIEAAYAKIERLPLTDDAPLFAFMHTECDFSCEHADGSFLDHLLFCREYTARHYAAAPPRAMLLHSILGVGTNLFPMPAEKLPTLERLVGAEDMVHISAFPSILRLLIHGYLLPELLNGGARGLTGLSCHRLIDNKRIHLGAGQLWVHLNLQLIHAIDFLPPAAWAHSNEYFFQVFVGLHTLLTSNNQLRASVEFDPTWAAPADAACRPSTWRHYIVDSIPTRLVLALASRQIAKFSAQVGHSLEYTLHYADRAE